MKSNRPPNSNVIIQLRDIQGIHPEHRVLILEPSKVHNNEYKTGGTRHHPSE